MTITKSEKPDLDAVIGQEAAVKLRRAYGGALLYIPTMGKIDKAARNAHIRSMKAKGYRVSVIAEKAGLSPRSICGILKKKT